MARIGCLVKRICDQAVGPGRTIAHNEAKAHRLLSTLIEACASKRRGLAISNEGAIRCVTIVSTL